jgi:SPOR domain
LRAEGALQGMDERLAELIRLIDSTGGLASAPVRTETTRELEPRRPPFDPAPNDLRKMTPVAAHPPEAFELRDRLLQEGGELPAERPSRLWIFKALALVLAGSALLGAGFGVWAAKFGASKTPPVVAAAEDLARAPQPSPEPSAPAGDAGSISPKDVEPAPVNVVASEQKPRDIDAHVPVRDPPEPPAMAPAATAQPANGASARPLPEAPIGAPAVTSSGAPQTASKAPDSGPPPPAAPARDTNPGATTPYLVADRNRPAHVGDSPHEPSKLAATAESARVAAQPRPAPKRELTVTPPKRPRLVVAKAEAPAPGGAGAQPPREPLRLEATIIAPPAAAAPQAAPAAPLTVLAQPLAPLAHAFNTVAGAFGRGAPQTVAPPAPSGSDDWAVQFAAPKSEAQAATEASRLNARYARALHGAKISVQKTKANGETVYALRASGLTRAGAAALCERAKGRDCSLTK